MSNILAHVKYKNQNTQQNTNVPANDTVSSERKSTKVITLRKKSIVVLNKNNNVNNNPRRIEVKSTQKECEDTRPISIPEAPNWNHATEVLDPVAEMEKVRLKNIKKAAKGKPANKLNSLADLNKLFQFAPEPDSYDTDSE